MNLKKRMLRAFILYSIDMAAAIAGWIYGFGMQVANWWALIAIMLGVRFVFHVLCVASANDDAALSKRLHAKDKA